MEVQVCTHICRCYRVSAQFEACRESIVEQKGLVRDVCRVLYYKVGNYLTGKMGFGVGDGGRRTEKRGREGKRDTMGEREMREKNLKIPCRTCLASTV